MEVNGECNENVADQDFLLPIPMEMNLVDTHPLTGSLGDEIAKDSCPEKSSLSRCHESRVGIEGFVRRSDRKSVV